VIVASILIVTVAVIIFYVNTVATRYSESVATSRSIPHLTRLSRRVYANATQELLGMNLKQVSMLAALRDQGELPQTLLCDMMKLTQNTVVTWLNELEEAGYVSRVRDPSDRRKHNVALTETGTAALERAETELRRLEDEVLSGLNADERGQLRRLLAKALEALT
jgi:DNA-binding MarR family transcriptional regulator